MSDDAIEPLEKRVAAILEDEHPDSAALATVLRDEDVGDIAVVDKLEPKQGELVLRALDEGRAAELLTQLEPGLTRELICCYAASGPGGRCGVLHLAWPLRAAKWTSATRLEPHRCPKARPSSSCARKPPHLPGSSSGMPAATRKSTWSGCPGVACLPCAASASNS